MDKNKRFDAGYFYSFSVGVADKRNYIIGDYNNWKFENCQYIYDTDEDGTYTGVICVDGEWQITENDDWNKSWNYTNKKQNDQGGYNSKLYLGNNNNFSMKKEDYKSCIVSRTGDMVTIVGACQDWYIIIGGDSG